MEPDKERYTIKQNLYFYWCRQIARLGLIKDPIIRIFAKTSKRDFFRYLREQKTRKAWSEAMVKKFCNLINLQYSNHLETYIFQGGENQEFWNFHFKIVREDIIPHLPREKHNHFFYTLTHILDNVIYTDNKTIIFEDPTDFFALETALYKKALEPYKKLSSLMNDSDIAYSGIPESKSF